MKFHSFLEGGFALGRRFVWEILNHIYIMGSPEGIPDFRFFSEILKQWSNETNGLLFSEKEMLLKCDLG